MPLNPSAATAFSHIALSVIHAHPFAESSSHLPDDFIVGGNPTKSVPSALHWLVAAWQKKPAPGVQSMEPHLHTPEFFVAPDPSEQAGAWLQVLEAATHIMPVSELHSLALAPQTHAAEEVCGAEPPGSSHAAAVTAHRHDLLSDPQSAGEAVLVLKYTEVPALFEEQPRG